LPGHADLLVGPATRDDAAVYRVAPDLALIATVDFITPVVDDPRAFGEIAAVNALSDVYAMGAEPILALNLAGFPRDSLPLAVLSEILTAAAAVVHEAGAVVAGGHTVDDPELKFGLSLIGRAHPDRVVRNSTARAGDVLYLSKPLGVGVITTALKRNSLEENLLARALELMRQTNRAAARAMVTAQVSAATDVSGFGLVGHLGEMTSASGVEALVHYDQVPILDGVDDLVRQGLVPGGTRRNLEAAADFTDFGSLDEAQRLVLADAQTSGGLLLAIPPGRAQDLEAALAREGVGAALIGELREGVAGRITIV